MRRASRRSLRSSSLSSRSASPARRRADSHLSINGWALAAAPISEITAALGGVVVGRATCGLPRPDIGRLYPGRDHAGHSGFMLSFDLPSTAGGTIEPLLTVTTEDGEIGRRPLRVDIPPQQVER